MSVHKESFGQLDNGTSVQKFILTNKNGMIVELIDYGATIVAIKVPNKDKYLTDVTLGFDNIGGYLSKSGKNPLFLNFTKIFLYSTFSYMSYVPL